MLVVPSHPAQSRGMESLALGLSFQSYYGPSPRHAVAKWRDGDPPFGAMQVSLQAVMDFLVHISNRAEHTPTLKRVALWKKNSFGSKGIMHVIWLTPGKHVWTGRAGVSVPNQLRRNRQ